MNITVVGGGFGGIKVALELARDHRNMITLISDKPDFQYYPALYSAATGHSHLMALGVITTYFGIEGLDVFSYGIKSEEEVMRLKRHLYEDIAENHTMDKHYVVIGAGPTGVELAAALGSYVSRLCEHYGVKQSGAPTIDLLEGAPRILPKMSEATSRIVTRRLKKLGVHIRTGQALESATADHIMVGGKPIRSRTVIWTAGVTNHPFYKEQASSFALLPNGRVKVDEFMKAAPDLYVIGDNAATPYSGLAQTALHDALFVAHNIWREQNGKAPQKYKAVKPPVVIPVGEDWAILEWHGLRISGWLGTLLRRAADFIGYNDMLPLGQALGAWHASMVMEDNYFTPAASEMGRTAIRK